MKGVREKWRGQERGQGSLPTARTKYVARSSNSTTTVIHRATQLIKSEIIFKVKVF
jgi:hypothetical protein